MDTNQRKAVQLGMPFGTAMHRLRKKILFSLIQRLGEDVCYRCGKRILSIEDLSIDHKKVWLYDDAELFWDLDNIAFSHYTCNVSISRKMPKQPISHGTHSGYSYYGCRCGVCAEAHRKYMRNWHKIHRKIK